MKNEFTGFWTVANVGNAMGSERDLDHEVQYWIEFI